MKKMIHKGPSFFVLCYLRCFSTAMTQPSWHCGNYPITSVYVISDQYEPCEYYRNSAINLLVYTSKVTVEQEQNFDPFQEDLLLFLLYSID